jgi:hypothetical protein
VSSVIQLRVYAASGRHGMSVMAMFRQLLPSLASACEAFLSAAMFTEVDADSDFPRLDLQLKVEFIRKIEL